ncbi:DNA-binding response regulator, partial [Erwinia amylovora]|nr:DNA-binding response regulator [Erwinia amylovora]
MRELLCFVMVQNDFQPIDAAVYDCAFCLLFVPLPVLILLVWMLPGGSGIKFFTILKREA